MGDIRGVLAHQKHVDIELDMLSNLLRIDNAIERIEKSHPHRFRYNVPFPYKVQLHLSSDGGPTTSLKGDRSRRVFKKA